MAARGGGGGKKHSATAEGVAAAAEWFASSNRSQRDVANWDFDYEALGDAVLGLLGDGIGVMFTRGSGGSSVGVIIMQGEKPWPREYYHEAEELEIALRHIAGRTGRKKGNVLKQ